MAPPMATGARRGRRGTLSRDQIHITALRIADRHGLEALTMRRVAAELGVDPMALYRYVQNKDALLGGIARKLWDEVSLPPRRHDDWKEPLRAFASGLRAVITRHPHTAALITQYALVRRSLEAYDILLNNMRDADYDDDRALQILTSAITAACADAFTALSYQCVTSASSPPSGTDTLIALSQMLPSSTPPHLIRTAYAICTCEPDTNFSFLLELILAGASNLKDTDSHIQDTAPPT